jgi:hypothetical protein
MTLDGFSASTGTHATVGAKAMLPKIEWSGKQRSGRWRVKRCYWKQPRRRRVSKLPINGDLELARAQGRRYNGRV